MKELEKDEYGFYTFPKLNKIETEQTLQQLEIVFRSCFIEEYKKEITKMHVNNELGMKYNAIMLFIESMKLYDEHCINQEIIDYFEKKALTFKNI